MAHSVADLDRDVQHLAKRGRVHREDAGRSLKRGRGLLDEAQRDGAHFAETLGKDEIRLKLLKELGIERVDAAHIAEALSDGGIYLGTSQRMVLHRGTGEPGEVLDTGRVVALVGHTDQSVFSADEVDNLGGARKE